MHEKNLLIMAINYLVYVCIFYPACFYCSICMYCRTAVIGDASHISEGCLVKWG